MTKEIKVIDYVMGTGKTKYIFEYMQANPHKKYIYVTPLLSEAEMRAVEQCGSISMVSPVVDERGNTKSQHMLELLKEGLNISTTHTMFKNLRKQHLKQIEYWGYTLIIDETVDFIESYNDYNQAVKNVVASNIASQQRQAAALEKLKRPSNPNIYGPNGVNYGTNPSQEQINIWRFYRIIGR